ncbi:hypothetical protein M0802_012308 [Mischocyttarus mexicanus]|nr:hypothetical protein M0802_012308 [Mischocyttarus mexicanus]
MDRKRGISGKYEVRLVLREVQCARHKAHLKETRGRLPTKPTTLILQTIREAIEGGDRNDLSAKEKEISQRKIKDICCNYELVVVVVVAVAIAPARS